MLDQVIYTRCLPYRNLKAGGAVVRGDGFGTHSMSQSIFAAGKKINFDYLQTRLVSPNASKEQKGERKEVGLLSSYEYSKVGENTYAMIFEYNREHCKIPRKNGKGHREGTFIKQALVGNLSGYPSAFFGADCWDAWKKSENDYYLDDVSNPEPAWLPQVSAAAGNGYITMDRVRTFVHDGRAEAVKTAVWFLLQQYAKPVSERKVLLIRDIPANVELWVAAIHFGFSEAMAREITFSTNRTQLGGQPDNALFYYMDNAGKFYPMLNRSIPMTRVPHNMIVGYHPEDKFSMAVKQLPTSNFIILDGAAKTLAIQEDADIRRPYYSALVEYDADIEDFCQVILPGLPLKQITDKLPDLFDAYKYLLDSSHKADKWSYDAALENLNILTQFGIPTNTALNEYLLAECVRIYGQFADRDEAGNFALLKIMWRIAGTIRAEREVIGCIADRLGSSVNSLPTRGAVLVRSWNAVKSGNIGPIAQPALRDLFNDTELAYYAGQFGQADATAVSAVLDMFLSAVSSDGGIETILSTKTRLDFLCEALAMIHTDRRLLDAALRRISTCENLLNAAALATSAKLESRNPGSSNLWWEAVTGASGGNVVDLCRKLVTLGKADIALVERLLVTGITRSKKCTRETQDVFVHALNKLGCAADTGLAFFLAWIKAADVRETADIVRAARTLPLNAGVKQDIFLALDRALPPEIISPANQAGARAVQEWAQELDQVSGAIAFAELNRALARERKLDRMIDRIIQFALYGFLMDEQFLTSELFDSLVAAAVDFCDGELHQSILCMFRVQERKTLHRYVYHYVAKVMENTKPGHQLSQFAALTAAMVYTYPVPNKALCRDVQSDLRGALHRTLENCYRSGWTDKVTKSTEYPPELRTEMLDMFQDVAASAGGSKLGDLFDRFGGFGRNRKK